MRKIVVSLTLLLVWQCGSAADPASKNIFESEISGMLSKINQSGHPIFISACNSHDGQVITLVIASGGVDGIQIAYNKDGIITSMSEITPSPSKPIFLVEANGGVYSQSNAERIFKQVKMLPFHLVDKVALEDITNPKNTVACTFDADLKS